MNRVTYLLKDPVGNVRARMVLPAGESVSLEPWMIHNIHQRGWNLEAWEAKESGIEIHGWVDWHGVADNLATVIRAMLDDGQEWSDEGAEQLLAQAQSALDDYHVAEMEIGMANPEPEEGDDGEGG